MASFQIHCGCIQKQNYKIFCFVQILLDLTIGNQNAAKMIVSPGLKDCLIQEGDSARAEGETKPNF